MAEYKFVTRGAGLAKAVAEGYYSEPNFIEVLGTGAEPLLPPSDLARLKEFLTSVHPRADRRTKKQAAEARELVGLVRASTADALIDEAKELLCRRIAGEALRPSHRPPIMVRSARDREVYTFAVVLKHAIEERLRQDLPLDIPHWGRVDDDAAFADLPLSERAMHLVHKALQDRGYKVPSVVRLRNQISAVDPALRELFVKAYGGV